jgi:RimJ/RimL family protein N-acetyltransferase
VQRPDPAVQVRVVHPKTGQCYLLLSAPSLYFSESRLGDLVRICNSADILEMIHRSGVPIGAKYTRRNAISFIKYCNEGWEDDDHYVFFLVTDDSRQRIAGCYELRNRHRESFETGYWIAPEHRGLGAAGLLALIELCRSFQVGSLFARVLEDNAASRRLLEKAGFRLSGRRADQDGFLRYDLHLKS